MDGLARCGGGLTEEFSVNGKLYRVQTLRLRHVLRMQARARLSMQTDCLAIAAQAAKGLPAEVRGELLKLAFERAEKMRGGLSADTADDAKDLLGSFFETEEGMAYILHLLIERADGTQLSEEQAMDLLQEIVEADKFAEVQGKLQLAQGGGELGNSSGRPTKPANPQSATGDPSSAAGPASSASASSSIA